MSRVFIHLSLYLPNLKTWEGPYNVLLCPVCASVSQTDIYYACIFPMENVSGRKNYTFQVLWNQILPHKENWSSATRSACFHDTRKNWINVLARPKLDVSTHVKLLVRLKLCKTEALSDNAVRILITPVCVTCIPQWDKMWHHLHIFSVKDSTFTLIHSQVPFFCIFL